MTTNDADALIRDLELVDKIAERLTGIFGVPVECVLLREHETWEEVNRREKWKRIAREEKERGGQSVERLRAPSREKTRGKADTRNRNRSLGL